MPSLRDYRRRIRTDQNIGKVTNAMSLVAGAKMRRAQQAILSTRPYAAKMNELLSHLAAMPMGDLDEVPPLLRRRPVQKIAVVHITPDRGLCGGLITNINRRTAQFLVQTPGQASVVTVGRKGRDFIARFGRDLTAAFTNLGERPSLLDTLPISKIVIDEFGKGNVDAVYLAYTEFVNTAVQRPVVKQLLPVEPAPISREHLTGYIYEPDPLTVLNALLPRIVEMQIYAAVLESIASEQSARMVAMKAATDNAKELVRTLTLEMNKVRQASITSELLDIIGGSLGVQK